MDVILRRESVNSQTEFHSPLIVFKLNNEKAEHHAILILNYLLQCSSIQKVLVEDKEIYKKLIFKETKLNEENLDYEKFFDLKIFDSDLNSLNANLCIVIGGDGTTLWANSLFKNNQRPPFLTFNLGTLGYMVIYCCDKYNEVLDELYNKDKVIFYEKRSTLTCNYIDTETNITFEESVTVLNDVVIERGIDNTMIQAKVFINDEPLNMLKCDGIIIST